MNWIFTLSLLLFVTCSPKVQLPVNEKPVWLSAKPSQSGYYTGIGHSAKSGSNNYIQAAKKSALEDLVEEIKVTVSSSSVLSTFENDRELTQKYEQIIQTTAADEIEEFEQVGSWEDAANYWIYYRLSIQRYRQIKEEKKRNAVILATDYLEKGQQSNEAGERIQALGFYFQAFRSIEKYLGEAIAVKVNGKDILLVNEIYASIQELLDKIELKSEPAELVINRRLNVNTQTVYVKAFYKDIGKPAAFLPLQASFEKGTGEVFPDYKTNNEGVVKILISKITSRELEQTVGVKLDIDAISGSGNSPVYDLLSKHLHVPTSRIVLKVKRPIAFITADEKSFGVSRNNFQIKDRLKNLLANAGFEFTDTREEAELGIHVLANSEKGSISGSIYITYLTGVINVITLPAGKEIFVAPLDRIKGYGLDYEKSSQDAYTNGIEIIEKEKIKEILNTILQ